jgi:hypothetical protein
LKGDLRKIGDEESGLEKAMQNVPQSVVKRLRETRPAAESHPDADLLTAFVEQSLAGSERAVLMEHLAVCGDCRDVVALALPETATEVIALPASAGIRGGWLTWPSLRWAALAAGILVVTWAGVLQFAHRGADRNLASNVMLKDAAPAATAANGPSSRQETTAGGEMQREPLSAPRSELTERNLAHDGRRRVEQGGPAAYARKKGKVEAAAEAQGTAASHTESAAASETQLAQNQGDWLGQDPNSANFDVKADVVKAKEPVPAQAVSASSAAPALAPPSMPLQTSPSLMLRVSARWAITAAGTLQRSFDGGSSWQNVNPNESTAADPMTAKGGSSIKEKAGQKGEAAENFNPVFRALAASGVEVWAGASGGTLYHSSDGGNHWARVAPSEAGTTLSGDVTGIRFSDPQQGKVSTSTGELWTTFDGGQTWHKQP